MNGHDVVGGILAVKAGVDTIKSLCGLLPIKKADTALIPIYRLVPSTEVAAAREQWALPRQAVGTEISKTAPGS
ncbi:MAG: hypothetical protein JWO51_1975 [Rhodospirillales bacterium]|nr:hypothetical protein [Rhodospirillales bacterium]